MNYYNEIKERLIDDEIYSKVKDYSKERNRVITYFEVGRLLKDAGKHYGNDIIGEYSKKLMIDVNRKYTKSTLFRMRQFYTIFSDEKVATLSQLLTWSHYVELLSCNDVKKIQYYIKIVLEQNLSIRKLRLKITNKEYERLKNKNWYKNPILIRNNHNYETINEKILQRLILEDISSFLKELGIGFTFIDNEYKIKIGNRYNYIDLLLFNYKYNCIINYFLQI